MNWDAYHAAIEALSAGLPIVEPAPGTRSRQRGESLQTLVPGRVVIVEGLFALWDDRTRSVANVRVFTEVDDDERVLRRIYRDITERGGNLDSVIAWFRRDVMPNYPIYTKSSRVYADVVVPTDRPLEPAVRILAAAVRALL
jgi:uridine kinase